MTMMATERELIELKEKFCALIEHCDLCPMHNFCSVGTNGFLKFLTDNVKTYTWEDEQ